VIDPLIESYSGNPLGLKLVAETVSELYDGNIQHFVEEETFVFGDIHEAIEQQFNRLSDLEKSILIWLAIEREAVSAQDLQRNFIQPIKRGNFREALMSLLRRSMIESRSYTEQNRESAAQATQNEVRFVLQNVILEYVTEKIIERIGDELLSGPLDLMIHYALLKTHSHNHVRENQRRLLLQPIAEYVLGYVREANLMKWAAAQLDAIRSTSRVAI